MFAKQFKTISIWIMFLKITESTDTTARRAYLWFDRDDPRVHCRQGFEWWDHENCPANMPQVACHGFAEDPNSKIFTWLCEAHNADYYTHYRFQIRTSGLHMYDMDDVLEEIFNPSYTLRVTLSMTPAARIIHYFVYPICFIWGFFLIYSMYMRSRHVHHGADSFSFLTTNSGLNPGEISDLIKQMKDLLTQCRDKMQRQKTFLNNHRHNLHDWLTLPYKDDTPSLIDQISGQDEIKDYDTPLVIYVGQVRQLEEMMKNLAY